MLRKSLAVLSTAAWTPAAPRRSSSRSGPTSSRGARSRPAWARTDPFANRHAASLRAIYDLADLEASLFIYQTGQSGLVFSPRYRDMSGEWAAVGYRPLRLQPQRWVHEARLVP